MQAIGEGEICHHRVSLHMPRTGAGLDRPMIAQSTRVGNASRCAHFGRRTLGRISGLLVEVSFGWKPAIPDLWPLSTSVAFFRRA